MAHQIIIPQPAGDIEHGQVKTIPSLEAWKMIVGKTTVPASFQAFH